MSKILRINSISKLHQAMNLGKEKHPLITLVDYSKVKIPKEYIGKKVSSELYAIMFKNNCNGKIRYGRQNYDFQDGTMLFIAPNQTITIEDSKDNDEREGFGLYFHPDLIRRSSLWQDIKNYTFFSYDVNEALHLSEKEQEIVRRISKEIENEYSANIDNYTHELIVSNIILLLNYCNRFYGRQFITRENQNKDIVEKLTEYLYQRVNSDELKDKGMPTVKDCAEYMCLSANYLSDLLKKETGKNTKDYIYLYLMDKAKEILLNTDKTVNEVAYELGFEYPEYFSKIFKKKTGYSPSIYRKESGNFVN